MIEVNRTYVTLVDGRPIVIHNVPMLQDPDTAETLYDLLAHPEHKTGEVTADVYEWRGEEVNA